MQEINYKYQELSNSGDDTGGGLGFSICRRWVGVDDSDSYNLCLLVLEIAHLGFHSHPINNPSKNATHTAPRYSIISIQVYPTAAWGFN